MNIGLGRFGRVPCGGNELNWWDGFLWKVGFSVCHQLKDRLLHYADMPLFVCTRDTGLFVGFFTLMFLHILMARRKSCLPKIAIMASLPGVAFFLWDSLTSYIGIRETTNFLRFVSGFACGVSLSILMMNCGRGYPFQKENGRKEFWGIKEWIIAVLVSGFILVLYLWRPSLLFRPAQAYLFLSLVGSLTILNQFLFQTLFVKRVDASYDGDSCVSVIYEKSSMRKPFGLAIAATAMTVVELVVGYLLHSWALSLQFTLT